MSRSGYTDEYDSYSELTMYRGQVQSAMRGKRGQKFFRDLVAALDSLPERRLIRNELATEEGVCALGALALLRGVALPELDHEDDNDSHRLAPVFDIASQLAAETMYMNDERNEFGTPEQRWERIRDWAARHIRVTPEELGEDGAVKASLEVRGGH